MGCSVELLGRNHQAIALAMVTLLVENFHLVLKIASWVVPATKVANTTPVVVEVANIASLGSVLQTGSRKLSETIIDNETEVM